MARMPNSQWPGSMIKEIPLFKDDVVNAACRGRATFVSSTDNLDNKAILPSITVVTRSGFRPQCLANLQASLGAQRGVQGGFLQIISNDAEKPGWTFVSTYQQFGNSSHHRIRLLNLKRENYYTSKGRCHSTKYLQSLYAMVPKNSWIVTLDDDARLTDSQQLRRIQLAASRSNPEQDVLLQDTFMGKKVIVKYPNYTFAYENATIPKIDTAAVIFHQSATKSIEWSGRCGGDKLIFKQLVEDGHYRPVHISQYTPGAWANYDGAAKQTLSYCNIIQLAPGERTFLDSREYRQAYLQPNDDLEDIAEVYHDTVRLRRRVKMQKAEEAEIAKLREEESHLKSSVFVLRSQTSLGHKRQRHLSSSAVGEGEV